MKKVIDIMTGDELEALPFSRDIAEEFIEHIINFHRNNADVHFGERYMVNSVLKYLENNSGITVMEVLEKMEKKGA